MTLFVVGLVFISLSLPAHCLHDGLYCGKESCYEVLGVARDAEKSDIAKAYRQLAKRWHPDMHQGNEAKKQAEKEFNRIATAYEILRDNDSRTDYDYMLDNPDEFYYNYYKYYYRRVSPKVDARIVIVVTITIISAIQYYSALTNYKAAIDYFSQVPKYRIKAKEIAVKEQLLETDKKKQRNKTKTEIKEEEEEIIKSIIRDKMDIRGGYSKPSVTDVLWIQLLMLPYTIIIYIKWYIAWVWRFNIKKEEYGEEEKFYVIRKFMGYGVTQWESIEEDEKLDYLRKNLWIKENFLVWKAEKEAEMKIKLAESSRYKSARRFWKNNRQQMKFGPE